MGGVHTPPILFGCNATNASIVSIIEWVLLSLISSRYCVSGFSCLIGPTSAVIV